MKTIAQQEMQDIKYLIESAGYRLSDLCRVAGIDHSQLSRWVNGQVDPRYSTVIKLKAAADALISARLQVINQAMEDAVK
jgi:transcriptional regulator with XRE-family HTH domain